MKRKFSSVILFLAMVATSNATDYFVDYNATSGGDGLSWSTALKSVQLADVKMASSLANADRVFVKGDVIPFAAVSWSPKSQNYYFSCAGTETEPDQRPKSDKDGNGVIEAWEFTYPSVITYTSPTGGTTGVVNFLAGTSTIIDGVTISANARVDNYSVVVVNWTQSSSTSAPLTASVLQNSIISNSNLNYTNNAKGMYGVLLKIADNGEAKNCLIEKNRIVCTNINNMAPITMVSLAVSTYNNSATNLTNVVIRNNYESITVDGPGVTSTNRIQALALGVYGGNGANFTLGTGTITNCLVYNNELSFSNPTAPTSNITSIAGTAFGMNKGKIIMHNCGFMNNKLTNVKSGLYLSQSVNFAYELINNLFWNNPNTFGSETSSAGMTVDLDTGLSDKSTFSNNVLDVQKAGGVLGAAINTNNFYDLNQTNAGSANSPSFANPTLFAGVNRVAGSADSIAIGQARWTLGQGSYLAIKGFAYTGISTDIVGNQFATPPSVGPYQYMNNTSIFSPNSFDKKSRLVNVENKKLITLTDQPISVYTTSGILIYSGEGKGKIISVKNQGMYIVNAAKDLSINKIIVY